MCSRDTKALCKVMPIGASQLQNSRTPMSTSTWNSSPFSRTRPVNFSFKATTKSDGVSNGVPCLKTNIRMIPKN